MKLLKNLRNKIEFFKDGVLLKAFSFVLFFVGLLVGSTLIKSIYILLNSDTNIFEMKYFALITFVQDILLLLLFLLFMLLLLTHVDECLDSIFKISESDKNSKPVINSNTNSDK